MSQRLAGSVEGFLYSAEQIAYADARGELRDLIRRRRHSHAYARVAVTRDLGFAVAGLGIWGLVGSVTRCLVRPGRDRVCINPSATPPGRNFRHGYAIGRAIPDEHRLLLAHPDK